ncbi:hypothetical protein [Mycoplasmopsis primatum]|uniref:hypothetical protein n=1 Tax=Mycoplasmopsis primatum TaxID=55604 RepID=UPI0004956EDC|nr:hypothetical protein [Mycoplasmopsis primatum]
MKITFKSLVTSGNDKDIKIELELDANFEIANIDNEEYKVYTFKEPDTNVATRMEFSKTKLNIFREESSLFFSLNERNTSSTIMVAGKPFQVITFLKSLDYEKNKAHYQIYLNDDKDGDFLASDCAIELVIK